MRAMRGTSRWTLALGLVFLGAAAGCRSLPNPPPLRDGGFLSSSLPPESERAADTFAAFSIGIHHELRDEHEEAATAYRKAAELDPDNELILLRLASTLIVLRRPEEALRTVETFFADHPASRDARLWLNSFYSSTGETARSFDLCRQMTEETPKDPSGWILLAAATADQAGEDLDAEANNRLFEEIARILRRGIDSAVPPTEVRQIFVRILLAEIERTPENADRVAALRKEAIELLEILSKDLPGDLDTLNELGRQLLNARRPAEAAVVLEKAARLQPSNADASRRVALSRLAMNDMPGAIAELERFAETGTDADIFLQIGDLYLRNQDSTQALDWFRRAAEASPDNPTPWLKWAATIASDRPQEAIDILTRARDLMPENPRLLEVLGGFRLAQKRYTEALRLFQAAHDLAIADDDPATPSTYSFYNLSIACTHLRRTAEAAKWLHLGMEDDPAILDAYFQRAMVSTRTFREATAPVLRALAAMDGIETAPVFVALGNLCIAREKPAQAVRAFERALAVLQTHPLQAARVLQPSFHFWFGVALDQDGQLDRASDQFEEVLRLDSQHDEALNYLSYLWATHGIRLEEALRHIQTALSIAPDNAAYLDTLGWVLYQLGRYEEALVPLLQADSLRPDDPEILDHIQATRDRLAAPTQD